MANVINATSTGNGGLVSTGDDSGILNIQTNETTAITVDASQNTTFAGTATATKLIPTGSSATGNGMYLPAANSLGFSTNGSARVQIYSDGVTKVITTGTSAPTYSFTNYGEGLMFSNGDNAGTRYSDIVSIANTPAGATSNIRFWTNEGGGAGTATEKMRISPSGDLLIGTTGYGGSGNAKTRVYKTGNRPNLEAEQGDSGGYNFQSIAFNNGGTYYHFNFQEGSTQRGSITSNGSNTAYNTGSDYRLKDDVVPMTGALNKISALKPVAWKWKSNGSDGQGFLAHELAEVCPDAVTGAKDAVDENGNPIYQMVDVSYLVATLTAAIQEQQALITAQAETINALTARIVALEQA